MKKWMGSLAVLMVVGLVSPAAAEDIGGADVIVCSAGIVIVCLDDGTCADSPPWTLNIPHFIVVDLKQKKLYTTQASHENRVTPINSVQRVDGFVVLQGYENGRAFNWMVTESTGMVTVTISLEGLSATAFGVCTPKPIE